nr:hypothetical protein [Patescibacteria group bacterium]
LLSKAKKMETMEIENLKREWKDYPERLKEEINDLKEFTNLPPEDLRVEFKKALDEGGIIHKWDGGSSETQLENWKERLEEHKIGVKYATIITDNEQLIGKSGFEKDLEKKVNELDSANHDSLKAQIVFEKSSALNSLKESRDNLSAKIRNISRNSEDKIEEYTSRKEIDITHNTEPNFFDNLKNSNKTLDTFLKNNEGRSKQDNYDLERERLGLNKLKEVSSELYKRKNSLQEQLIKHYITNSD